MVCESSTGPGCGAGEPPPLVPGYELEEQRGAGATGTVWAARRASDGRRVAVKVVRAGVDGDEAVRELTLLSRLRVEGLVTLHDVFGLSADPSAVALVLDLVEGGSLASVLAARHHLSPGEAVTVLAPVAHTLAGLHAAGVVHADVAPGNVLFERTGRPLLADLGVARVAGEAPGPAFGTEGFTAPEVGAGGQPSAASDVYGLGALAWACVTGEPPEPLGLRRPLEDLAPGLPAAFAEVLGACLAPLAADRPGAAEAALGFFDSAPCEPLRLVTADDEVSLLTRRLRQAGQPMAPASPAERPGYGRRTRYGWRTRHWWRTSRAPARHRGRGAGRKVRPRRGLRAALAMTAALAAGAGAVAWAQGWWPGQVRQVASRWTGPEQVPRASSQEVDPEPVALVQRDPVAAVREIADRRARLLEGGAVSSLGQLDHPGSPAWDGDERLLRELGEAGRRFAGLAFAVRAARTVSVGPARVTLAVRVDTLAYRIREADGRLVDRPAESGEEVLLDLRWSGQRWLVEQVRPSA
jgi:hypothetical protein